MVSGLAAVLRTSGGVVRDGIGGVGQLLPEAPVNILLHERVEQKSGESVQGYHGLHKEKTLHLPEINDSLREKKSKTEIIRHHV